MSDRVDTLVVVLEHRETIEVAEEIARAIRCIRGVVEVKVGPASLASNDFAARVRFVQELRKKLWDWADELMPR